MDIKTKYDVGHTFWVPRCHIQYEKETLVFEDNEWTRDVERYVAFAREKIIKKIVASTTCFNTQTGVRIQYYVVNVGEKNCMSQVYDENEITNRTEEEAYNVALEYQKQEKEYFGN